MANNLGILERTLAQVADSTDGINIIGSGVGQRRSWDQKTVVRITDHVSDTVAEEDDPEQMAIFECSAIGQPWRRVGTHLSNPIWQTVVPATDLIPTDVEVLYPDWDYTEYE